MNPTILDLLLLQSCAAGDVRSVHTLLNLMADVNFRTRDGRAPLLEAAARHPSVILTLLQAGADVQAVNRRGHTALHLAASAGNLRGAELLLQHGIDPRVLDCDGRTARDLALAQGHASCAALIAQEIHAWFLASGGSGVLVDASAAPFSPQPERLVAVDFCDGRTLSAARLRWNCVLELPPAYLRAGVRRVA